MCGICGCGQPETRQHRLPGNSSVQHPALHEHAHPDHAHHEHAHPDHPGHGHSHPPARDSDGDRLEIRTVEVQTDLLTRNDAVARHNRAGFQAGGILALNLVSSPGAGKTTLLERTLADLGGEIPFGVIEGDQQTDNDARRIADTGVAVIQITTGQACHLDAEMVHRAVHELPPLSQGGVLMIENVGNLVCPSLFDLGERCKVVVASVTEGEDKPEKYPYMFRAARLVLLNKIDLLPHVKFNVPKFQEMALRVNPGLKMIPLSATTREGMGQWYAWLRQERQTA